MKITNKKKKLTKQEQRNLTPEELLPYIEHVRDQGGRLNKNLLHATVNAIDEAMANVVYKKQLDACNKQNGELGQKIGKLNFERKELRLTNERLRKQLRRLRTSSLLQNIVIIFMIAVIAFNLYG